MGGGKISKSDTSVGPSLHLFNSFRHHSIPYNNSLFWSLRQDEDPEDVDNDKRRLVGANDQS